MGNIQEICLLHMAAHLQKETKKIHGCFASSSDVFFPIRDVIVRLLHFLQFFFRRRERIHMQVCYLHCRRSLLFDLGMVLVVHWDFTKLLTQLGSRTFTYKFLARNRRTKLVLALLFQGIKFIVKHKWLSIEQTGSTRFFFFFFL